MCSLSAGSSALKRAKLHGPSAYACLSLTPSGKGKAAAGLPSMTTAAQQPSFCPAFLARQTHDVVLDCQGMKVLCPSELRRRLVRCAAPGSAASAWSQTHLQPGTCCAAPKIPETLRAGGAEQWRVRDAAAMVWSLAALGGQPEHGGFLAAAQDALAPRLGAASGLDLANLAWGLAMARAPLRPAFMDAFTVRA